MDAVASRRRRGPAAAGFEACSVEAAVGIDARVPTALAFSHTARGASLLAVATEAGSVYAYDARWGECRRRAARLCEVGDLVSCVAWSANDTRLAVSSLAASIVDVAASTVVATLGGDGVSIKCARFLPLNPDVVVCARRSGVVCLFDLRASATRGAAGAAAAAAPSCALRPVCAWSHKQPSHGAAAVGVTDVACLDRFVITAGAEDGAVKVFDLRRLPRAASASVPRRRLSPDDGSQRVGADDGRSDGAVARLACPLANGHRSGVSCLDLSFDGCRLLVGYRSSRLAVLDTGRLLSGAGGDAGIEKAVFDVPLPPPVAATPQSARGTKRPRLAATAAAAAAPLTPQRLASLRRAEAPALAAALRMPVVANETPERCSVRSGASWATVAQASPGPRHVAAGLLAALRPPALQQLVGHYAPTFDVRAAFSRCGDFVASGSADGRAYVWAAAPGGGTSRGGGASSGGGGGGAQRTPSWVLCHAHRPHPAAVPSVLVAVWGGTPPGYEALRAPFSVLATACAGVGVRLWRPGCGRGAAAAAAAAALLRGDEASDSEEGDSGSVEGAEEEDGPAAGDGAAAAAALDTCEPHGAGGGAAATRPARPPPCTLWYAAAAARCCGSAHAVVGGMAPAVRRDLGRTAHRFATAARSQRCYRGDGAAADDADDRGGAGAGGGGALALAAAAVATRDEAVSYAAHCAAAHLEEAELRAAARRLEGGGGGGGDVLGPSPSRQRLHAPRHPLLLPPVGATVRVEDRAVWSVNGRGFDPHSDEDDFLSPPVVRRLSVYDAWGT